MRYARFDGGRTGSGPLTWGQRNMLAPIAENPPGHFNLARVLTPPERAELDADRATALVGQLLDRHESLRTLVSDDVAEQRVRGSGRLPVEVVDCDPEDQDCDRAAERLRARLVGPAFDHTRDLPVRAGVVTAAGRVRRVVLAFSHLAVDGTGVDIVERELRLLALRGTVGAPPGGQPLDLAAREQAHGHRRTTASVDHWSTLFQRIPPYMFGNGGPAYDPPCQRLLLTSPALLAAARLLAARYRTGTSTVLLAAAAAMVGRWTGHPSVAVGTLVGNRFRAGQERMVATLTQLGLFALDLADLPEFPALIPDASRAAIRTYRCAYYDPAAMKARLDLVNAERGVRVDPYCCFNDVRADPDLYRHHAPPEPAEVAAARDGTTLTALPPLTYMRCRFCLNVSDAPGAVALRLTADTRSLAPPEMARFLRETERLVIDAALRPAPSTVTGRP